MTDARPVLLVDFSALFRRGWHVSSEMSHAYESTIAGVNRARGMLPDSLVAICCDGRGNWRKALHKEYKAQRESQPQQMFGEMDRTLDRLCRDGHLIWKFDGFEADDVIATAVMMATTRGHWCRIVSHDKDLLQLLSVACDYLAIHKTPWEVADRDIVKEKYGIDPSQFGDWLALVGDSSDNVKGCPGVGAKTATLLLQAHGSLDFLYGLVENDTADLIGVTPNIRKNLLANKEQVYLARKLVSLSREVPIKFDEIYETREIAPIDERDMMKEAETRASEEFDKISDGTPDKREVGKAGAAAKETDLASSPATLQNSEKNGETPDVADTGSAIGANRPEQPEQAPSVTVVATSVAQAPETALVPIVEYSRQLEPRSFREASIACDVLFNSRVYSRYPTKQSMVAAVLRGREMGYGLGASLDMFHVADFNNDGNLRLMMHAHLIKDQADKDPGVEYIDLVSTDDTQCTYEAKKKGRPAFKLTYTIEQANKAGLVRTTRNGQPNTWMKRPAEQLRKTCAVQISRIVAPGATLGLYCMEEMGVDE